MDRHVKCTSSNTLPKTSVLQPKNRVNLTSFKQQNPITVSEKLNNFEKKFETVVKDIDHLKVEFQLSKEQNYNAVSERLDNLDEKFKTVILDVVRLGSELQLSMDELLASKNEIAKVTKENTELRSMVVVSTEEIRKISAETFDLKAKLELQRGTAASVVTMTDVTSARRIFLKLPCDTVSELDMLKEDLIRDIPTLIYMVSIILGNFKDKDFYCYNRFYFCFAIDSK